MGWPADTCSQQRAMYFFLLLCQAEAFARHLTSTRGTHSTARWRLQESSAQHLHIRFRGLPPRVALSDRVSVLHTEAEEGAVVVGIESPWPQTCNRFQDPDSSLMSYHQREVVVGDQTTMTTTWSLASDELASKGTLWRCVRNTSPTQPIASAATAENPVSCKGDNVEKNTAQKTVKMTQKNLENGDYAPLTPFHTPLTPLNTLWRGYCT